MELFASRGYEAVGVQEIVDAAGLTKPTLYHYFGSKHGLLRALLLDHYERLKGAVEKASDYHGDLPLTLRRVAQAYFQFSLENPTFYRLQLALFFAPRKSEAFTEVSGLNEGLFFLVEGLFQRAVRDHGNMMDRQRLYAASFIGTINNCIGLSLNGYLTLDEALLERVVAQFEHGIYS